MAQIRHKEMKKFSNMFSQQIPLMAIKGKNYENYKRNAAFRIVKTANVVTMIDKIPNAIYSICLFVIDTSCIIQTASAHLTQRKAAS